MMREEINKDFRNDMATKECTSSVRREKCYLGGTTFTAKGAKDAKDFGVLQPMHDSFNLITQPEHVEIDEYSQLLAA